MKTMTPAGAEGGKGWLGWHFLAADKRLGYGDGREVVVGETLTQAYPHAKGDRIFDAPTLCESGMHASPTVLAALAYTPGFILCRVELLGERIDGDDKSVARSRRCLAMADARDVITAWAFACADRAVRVHAANALDSAGLKDRAAILRALVPITSIETADAARAAAGDAWAARDAAWAARAACAARDAAWAARDAAYAYAAAAAAAAAAAERKLQAEDLEARCLALLGVS